MIQRLRALAFPSENLSLIPSTHVKWLTITTSNFRSKGSDALFQSLQAPRNKSGTQIYYMQAKIPIDIRKKNDLIKGKIKKKKLLGKEMRRKTGLSQERAAEAHCLGLPSCQDGCGIFVFVFPPKPCFSQAESLQAEDLAIQFSVAENVRILQ